VVVDTKELRYTCPACETDVVATFQDGPHGHVFEVTNHASSFVCEHWREVHEALSDLADGRDPEARCSTCGENPCKAGSQPLSCF
jgi:hypothetical protein